jgi:Tol biopolymer transport system component
MVDALYHEALQRDPAERHAFLAGACGGDTELLAEVQSLLAQTAFETGSLMALAGRRIAQYELRTLIGVGGMGEVYRAFDTQLRREVAIKILPPHLTRDPARVARFEREARALAALSHPTVAAIYGTERASGIEAIVMELVEGETLAERLARAGPRPVAEAMAIARQIADGLDAAHERGIIHRDLKPANIRITSQGAVKLLDFGLARVTAESANDVGATPGADVTREGLILGTAAYMSPEQARGHTVDKRTDVWAFGCVLYEMLTGVRPFDGGSVSDAIAAVLTTEPSWERVPSAVPAHIQALVRRCLQKNPSARLRDIADAKFHLDESAVVPAAHITLTRPLWQQAVVWLLAVGTTAAISAAVWRTWAAPAPMEVRLDITAPSTTEVDSLALSPDGRTLAFVATSEGKPRLWLRPLNETEARVLPGTDHARFPFWSPDGRSIGFTVDTDLKRIDLASGAVQMVLAAGSPYGGVWMPDDTILGTPGAANPLIRVPARGGRATPVTRVNSKEATHRFPRLLPDGRHFLAYASGTDPGIYLGNVDTGETRKLLDASAAVYAPSGHVLFVQQGTLFAQRFDTTRLELRGTATPVARQIALGAAEGSAALAVSAAGPIAYRSGVAEYPQQFMWVDRSGKVLSILRGTGAERMRGMGAALSKDDRFVTWTNASGELSVLDVTRGLATPFTRDAGVQIWPVWAPDGRRVAFSSNRDGDFDLFVKATDGTSAAERLLRASGGQGPDDWSPDGRALLYSEGDKEIWALPFDGKPFPVVRGEGRAVDGQFSPSGKWIAFRWWEAQRPEIYIQPFPKGQKILISTAGGVQPRWRPDGKELFYIAPDNRLMAVPVDFDTRGQIPFVGVPEPLFAAHWDLAPQSPGIRTYAVSRDGQRFLIQVLAENVSPVTVILNWRPPE